jgi:23S rRNA (guanosine2251-2'-O)-methyltransferase
MSSIILIAHNLRSAHNIGSLLRTADGLGIDMVYLTGYTPYPHHTGDARLPHEAQKIDRQIAKTSLGAEQSQPWRHESDVVTVLTSLKNKDFTIAALEQTPNSLPLPNYRPPEKIAIIVGREVEGIEPEVLKLCNVALEIPMRGAKESFNVVQAAAMAAYHCRYSG